jgi:hypothetical protein
MTDVMNPPTVEPTDDWLSSRRAHLLSAVEARAPAPRGFRGNWRVAAVVVAVLLFAGAAVAATGYTLFDWLRSDDPGAARFSIDPTRTVDWRAPEALTCGNPGSDFTCVEGSSGRWVYESLGRIESPGPAISRARLLAAVEAGEREGRIPQEMAARLRAEIAAVGDEFFEKLNVLLTFRSVASPHSSRPGYVLVPPAGVPQFVTCEPGGSEFQCRTLSAATSVPVGAPIYGLRESAEWIERPQSTAAPDGEALDQSVFGRPLTPAEQRLLITLSTPAASSGGQTGGATTTSGG